MFLSGDTIKASLHGAHPSYIGLDQGELKCHTDFRSIYTTLLEDWLGRDTKVAVGGELRNFQCSSNQFDFSVWR
jgi:uncharacterized protein (DUF1501 family)